MTNTTAGDTETVLVMNPLSGTGDHGPDVRDRAALSGYTLRETQHEKHAIELAQSAAESGADEVVAVGGDGTLNEIVCGVRAADALDRVTVGVVPVGTGNDFATNIGITSLDNAFRILREGQRRWLDLGLADGQPFVNSCLAGVIAEASGETSSELKSRFGPLAYVLTTLRMATAFTGIDLRAVVDDGSETETVWEGTATVVLVGNGRRFSLSGSEQANVEDGLFDVTIIEDIDSLDLAQERLQERLLHREGEHLTRFLASSLELDIEASSPATFSLDGEILEEESLSLRNCRQVLRMPVGDGYEPRPGVL
jgi:YegS/Rv2252/BmrU family lipid kinase